MPLSAHRRAIVQREIEQQHVHHRLAEHAELAAFDVRVDQLPDCVFADTTLTRDARHLDTSPRPG